MFSLARYTARIALAGALGLSVCLTALAQNNPAPQPPQMRVTDKVVEQFIKSFGSTRGGQSYKAKFDFNNDGIINTADHSVLMGMRAQQQQKGNGKVIKIGRQISATAPGVVPAENAPPADAPSDPATPPPSDPANETPPTDPAPSNPAPPQGTPPTTPPPSNPPQEAPAPTTPPTEPPGQTGPTAPSTLPGSTFSATVDAEYRATLLDTGGSSPVPIISPNGMPLWTGGGTFPNPVLRPTITFTPTTNGFDVTYLYVNNTGQRRSLGSIMLGGIRFGREVQTRDFFYDGKPSTIRHNNGPMFLGGGFYPGQYYSPVMIVGEEPYTIGISVQYPVVEYKHEIYMRLEVPGGMYIDSGLNWMFRCELCPTGTNYSPDGDIAPGDTRTYVMSVRVFKNHPDEWLRLLIPYREFFRATYGPVDYVRDARPVCGITTTQGSAISESNPYGYVSVYPNSGLPETAFRPDLSGWTYCANEWKKIQAKGWDRFMVWTPTGLYKENQDLNFPSQFTSQWREMPAVMRTLSSLRQFSESVPEFGLWWGRSGGVMDGWDRSSFERFDPSRPAHVANRMNEIRLAKEIKVTSIGLDSLVEMRPWDAYTWVQRLKEELPGVKFVMEPRWCDVMHNLIPMFIVATQDQNNRQWEITQPHSLADFLNPGHETWGMIDHNHTRQRLGHMPSTAEMNDVMRHFADMGYVPLDFWGHEVDRSIRAAESWRTSVPADLQVSAP